MIQALWTECGSVEPVFVEGDVAHDTPAITKRRSPVRNGPSPGNVSTSKRHQKPPSRRARSKILSCARGNMTTQEKSDRCGEIRGTQQEVPSPLDEVIYLTQD